MESDLMPKTLFTMHPDRFAKCVYLIVIVAAAFTLAVLSYGFSQDRSRINAEATRLRMLEHQHNSIFCAVQASYQGQVNTTRRFLREHPSGLPQLGLTRPVLLRGLRQNEARLLAFKRGHLRCAK